MDKETKKKKGITSVERKMRQSSHLSTANTGAMSTAWSRKESETEEFLTQPIWHLV